MNVNETESGRRVIWRITKVNTMAMSDCLSESVEELLCGIAEYEDSIGRAGDLFWDRLAIAIRALDRARYTEGYDVVPGDVEPTLPEPGEHLRQRLAQWKAENWT
jgi:hypothetical protein